MHDKEYAISKINMLCNLCCLKTRLRLLCDKHQRHSSLNLVSQELELCNIFIFGMAYRKLNIRIECQSPFTKLWQSCSDPHPNIRPIAIFAFYSQNYSLAARLQYNSRTKSPIKVKTKIKLQQLTVFGWLIMSGGASGEKRENFKAKITFNMKFQYNYQHLFA